MEYYSKKITTSKEGRKLSFFDVNQPIFSFNFGLSLLEDFVKIEFGHKGTGTFGVSVLDNFIKL